MTTGAGVGARFWAGFWAGVSAALMKSLRWLFQEAGAEAVSSGWVARVGVVEPNGAARGGCVDARFVWTLLVLAAVRCGKVCAGRCGLMRLG